MSFLSGLVGQNPEINWHYNTLSANKNLAKLKTKSVAIVKTKGSLGTFKLDCMKVAIGALAFLAACLIGGSLSYILVGAGAICLYKSVKKYTKGTEGELRAEASVKIKGVVDAVKGVTDVTRNTADSIDRALDSAAVTFHGFTGSSPKK
jgi:hypothetical protein